MKRKTIFRQLILNIIIPTVGALSILAFINYLNTRSLLIESNRTKNDFITEEALHLMEFNEISLDILNKNYDSRLEKYTNLIIENYFAETDSIEKSNLYRIRKELGMTPEFEDIYIINEYGIIVNTTFEPDLNLDFFSFGEEHKKYLLDIMVQGKFKSERFSQEASTKRLKKYSYKPTLDKRYIVELGSYSKEADTLMTYINTKLKDIKEKQKNIVSVDIFIGSDKPIALDSTASFTNEDKILISRIFEEKESIKTIEKENGEKYEYSYIYRDLNSELYKGIVTRIISDKTFEDKFIRKELYKFLLVFGITLALIIYFFYTKIKKISLPIINLAKITKKLAKGNFEEEAEVTGNNEITELSKSFNEMTKKIKASRDKIEEYNATLERKVDERTRVIELQNKELEEKNEELEKLSIVAKHTDNAVIIFDKELQPEWANDGFTHLTGFSLEDYLSGRCTVFVNLKDNPKIKEDLRYCVENNATISYNSKITTKDKEKKWVQTTLTPITDLFSQPLKYIAINSEITKIKEAEAKVTKQKKELEIQNDKIEFKNKQIKDSITYAERIQKAILPLKFDIEKVLDIFIFQKPKDIVSGDFIWFTHIPDDGINGDKVFIAAVDCTGHGVPGAFMSIIGSRLLDDIIIEKRAYNLEIVLSRMNKGIKEILKQEQTENQDGMDVCLCMLEKIEGNRSKVTFAGAKRPLYIYRSKHQKLDKIPGARKSIGGIASKVTDSVFKSHKFILEDEDIIYLTTDGFSDQQNVKRKKYGSKKLETFLESIGANDLPIQIQKLGDEFSKHSANTDQRDDVTIIGIKAKMKDSILVKKVFVDWSNKNILIAEDEDLNYLILKDLLAPTKAKLHWARNGKIAVEEAKKQDYNIVLMDIRMPEMDGYEATKQIKEIYPELPIIVITAYSMSNEKEKSFEAGCDDYIAKPFKAKEIFATINKYFV